LAAVEMDTFEVLFPTDVVFANLEEVKVGPVGPAVIVEYFGAEEFELLGVPVLLGPAVVELAFKVIVVEGTPALQTLRLRCTRARGSCI